VACGSVPPGVREVFFALVAGLAILLGGRTVVDSSGAALKAALAEGVTIIKPNLVELSDLVGSSLGNDDAYIAACRKLIADGRVEIVALTLGEQGALLVTSDHAFRSEPLAIEMVSTVGAGDSFLGGLVAALSAGEDLQHAFRVAVAAGSAAVLSPGTELCHEEDVRRLLPQIKISELSLAPA
jgi:6-phosphofructokinase 2